jgi:hypothetical protein
VICPEGSIKQKSPQKSTEEYDFVNKRVVHSSHFLAIFASFLLFIFLPFFENELKMNMRVSSKMSSKMRIF